MTKSRSQIFTKILLLFFVGMGLALFPLYAEEEEDEESLLQQRMDILEFGLESEISDLINTLQKEKDDSLSEELTKIFFKTKNVTIREKIISFFTIMKNPSLKDYTIEIIEDPYDIKVSTAVLLIKYAAACSFTEAAPSMAVLLESENEDYYDACLASIGDVGGSDEAVFLAGLLDKDLTLGRRQSLMKSLGKIKAVETWDKLVEIAENEDENSYVRMYAAEAIGAMGVEDSVPVLAGLFESADSNLRTYVLKGLSYFPGNEEAESVLLEGFRDNYYKVRLESAAYAETNKFQEAMPNLLYRAKNDSESAVVYACYQAIGAICSKEGMEFLVSVVQNEKKGDTARAKAAVVILNTEDVASIQAVLEVTEKTLEDTKKTALRYAIGKELALHETPLFEDICKKFLENKDASTIGIGMDIWAKNKYPALKSVVEGFLENKNSGLKRKAALVLEKDEKKEEE
ncbi:MAG: HEAT repeat domain-containing protein [Treponemataceae bacterium]|nr:HEAT repeat domain-containing protein [Treponemataceae bacterium]